MRNIKLVLSYDGTDFFGWQRQPDRRTVQQVLEEAVGEITGAEPVANASGRTDAGVHALGQVVHFFTATRLSTAVLVKALNATLPRDVRVMSALEMPQSFHSTVDAKSKRYRYVIDNGPISDPFLLRYAWHVYPRLNAEWMHEAGQTLVGRHDFHSFETHWPNRMSSVRTVSELVVERKGSSIWLEVEADGFLYNMVRAIMGTLMLVGVGKKSVEWVGDVLRAESRAEAGPNAPPQGLFLVTVRYDSSGGDSCES
jgi:tRNA pseudouridine38-40 synthase